jgi:hypothetical protein
VLALIISYALVAYLFVPTTFFRLRPGSILKKFQRTRVEELTFAVEVSIIPWLVTLILAWTATRVGWITFASWANYREVFSAAYSEDLFRSTQPAFWDSLHTLYWDQIYLLVPAYAIAYLEGWGFEYLIKNYWWWRENEMLSRRLLGNVSEWYMLLSTIQFAPDEGERHVAVDLLTIEDHLYQGNVGNYFLNPNGELSGLLVTDPRRFDRQAYLEAKKENQQITAEEFWRNVPGANMYVPADKVVNINVRYPLSNETPQAVARAANVTLARAGLHFEIASEGPSNNQT